jgi:XTP/dITP diphosphohydrolase/tetrapyrrole methylase family protein/MazG family protein
LEAGGDSGSDAKWGGQKRFAFPESVALNRAVSQSQVERLREIMARLRAPDGCPWDREQTHATLSPYLIEECCELLDAIDRNDSAHMEEELGDVLLQVVFHAQLAAEAGRFDLEGVARSIADKLVRRHPHVFGEGRLATSGEVLQQWEKIKAGEKGGAPDGPTPLVKDLPPTLSALRRAHDTYRELAKKQALPRDRGVFDEAAAAQLAAALDETTAGRKLFELVAACRHAGIEPETALRQQIARVVAAAEADRAASAAS